MNEKETEFYNSIKNPRIFRFSLSINDIINNNQYSEGFNEVGDKHLFLESKFEKMNWQIKGGWDDDIIKAWETKVKKTANLNDNFEAKMVGYCVPDHWYCIDEEKVKVIQRTYIIGEFI